MNENEQIEMIIDGVAEPSERDEAMARVIEDHTPEQLAVKVLESYETVESLMMLLRVLCHDPNTMSAVERTLYESAHARRIRDRARASAYQVVSQWDAHLALR